MKIAIYARVSTARQEEKQTIQNQLSACREYATQHDYEIVEEFTDDGVGGAIPFPERPAAAKLLEETRNFDRVLIYSVDRLGRDVEAGVIANKQLTKVGTPAEYVSQSFDDTPSGEFMFHVFLSVAQLERSMISDRTRRGRTKSARNNNWVSPIVPFGYRKGEDKKLFIYEPEANIFRKMVEWCIDENMGVMQIASRLNSYPELYPPPSNVTRRAGQWNDSTVVSMLRHPRYMGKTSYTVGTKTKEPIKTELDIPPIIGPGEHAAVLEALERRRIGAVRATKTFYLLQGMIRCGQCASGYFAFMEHDKQLYACARRRRAGKKDTEHNDSRWYWKAPELDDRVKRAVLELVVSPQDVLRQYDSYEQRTKMEHSHIEDRKALLVEEIRKLEHGKESLIDYVARGTLTQGDVAERIEKIREEMQANKAELEALSTNGEDVEVDVEFWSEEISHIALASELRAFYHLRTTAGKWKTEKATPERLQEILETETCDPASWRELIESVVDEIVVNDKGEPEIMGLVRSKGDTDIQNTIS